MKKLTWCFFVLLLCSSARSQWTTSGNNIYNTNTGNVGIGTSSPQAPLDANGIRSNKVLYVDKAGGNLTSYFYIINRSANEGSNFGNALGNGAVELAEFSNAGLLLGSYSGNIAFCINNNAVAGRIFPTGNWYLGPSPVDNGYKLQVSGNIAATGLVLPTGAAAGKVLTSDASGNATWQTASGGSGGWSFGGNTVGAIKTLGTIDNYDLSVITNNVERMRITATGNVGIGTANTQGYQLAVNGSAIFTSAWIKPYANWPDYVFNKDYKLPSLDSLSKYIESNNHLPDFPSAETIAKTGIDLGSNQAALLKKVEELTLYIIRQDKAIQEYDQKFKQQDQHTKALEERIERLERLVKQ